VQALGTAYEPFVELTIIPLFRLGSLTKKIVANQTQNTAKAIILHAHPHPRLILPMLLQGVQDKNLSVRQYSIAHLRTVVETSHSRSKSLIETTGGLDVLEKCIKKSLIDQNAGLRDSARALFWAFETVWRERAEAIANTLDATARKQLDKAAPSGLSPLTPPASAVVETKKSSVAAAIAASRAKARQIAAAPPTLRHAATAHASTMASQARRPPSPNSPSANRTAPTSFSPPPTAKRSSGIFQKSATSPSLGQTTTRSPSNTKAPSNASMSPPSSPTQSPTHKPLNISRTTTSPSASQAHLRSPPNNITTLKSSLSTRSASPPVSSKRAAQPKRASGIFSSPKGTSLSPTPVANDTLTLSPHQSDDESLMRVRAPNSEAGSNESLPMASFSDAVTSTPPSRAGTTALTRSTNPLKVPGPVIEDDLRARAAQAESAAERLLEELSEPDETAQINQLSRSLVSSASTTPGKGSRSSKSNGTKQQAQSHSGVNNNLSTPVNKRATVLRQVAAFQDSPPYKGGSHSIVERLQDNRNESSWWLKRVARKYTILD
jgi:CLIP-associating protein 1/2